MYLLQEKSECSPNQKRIVSRERGENREHIAINPDGRFVVRHYRLDGNIITNQTCCDYLLINDSAKKVYYIELKGKNIERAVEQLLAAEKICHSELKYYVSYYRIVSSKSPTHNNEPKKLRNLKDRYGTKRVICKERRLEETLD